MLRLSLDVSVTFSLTVAVPRFTFLLSECVMIEGFFFLFSRLLEAWRTCTPRQV